MGIILSSILLICYTGLLGIALIMASRVTEDREQA